MRKHPVLGRIAGYAFAIVFILAGWQFTAMAVHNPVLPGPFDAFSMVAQYFDELWPAFLVSLYRVVVAMLIGTVLAIPLGLACGRSPRADAVFAPILYFLYPLPKVVLLPVLIVLLAAVCPKSAGGSAFWRWCSSCCWAWPTRRRLCSSRLPCSSKYS